MRTLLIAIFLYGMALQAQDLKLISTQNGNQIEIAIQRINPKVQQLNANYSFLVYTEANAATSVKLEQELKDQGIPLIQWIKKLKHKNPSFTSDSLQTLLISKGLTFNSNNSIPLFTLHYPNRANKVLVRMTGEYTLDSNGKKYIKDRHIPGQTKTLYVDTDFPFQRNGVKEYGFGSQDLNFGIGQVINSGVVGMVWQLDSLKRFALDTTLVRPTGYWGSRWKTGLNYHFEDYQIYYAYDISTTTGQKDFEQFLNAIPACAGITLFSYGKIYGGNITSNMNKILDDKFEVELFTHGTDSFNYVLIADENSTLEKKNTGYVGIRSTISNTHSDCFNSVFNLLPDEQIIVLVPNNVLKIGNSEVQIYPNPSNSRVFNLNLPTDGSGIIQIYSTNGTEIYKSKIHKKNLIDLRKHAAGSYLARITFNNKTYQKTLILE